MKVKNSIIATVFGVLGVLNGVGLLAFAFFSGSKQEFLVISVSGITGMLICFAVGGVLQYLYEITQHLEMCRRHLSELENQGGKSVLPEIDENYDRRQPPKKQQGGSL